MKAIAFYYKLWIMNYELGKMRWDYGAVEKWNDIT